ncbi:DUF4157 domain-containing protein [Candidatus Desantisbacteria bacterium]|nr:DUF4157 domain-containing protein [Candidatus Desantisbacteria bacterium]
MTLQKIRGNRVVQELFRNIDTIQCKDHEKSVSMDIQYCPIEYTLQYAITLTEKDLIEQIHLYQQKLSKDDTDSPVYPVYLNNLIVLEEAAMQKIKNKEHQSQIFSKDEKVIPGSTATLSTSHEVSASDVVKFARDNYSNLPYGKFADAKKTIPLDIQKDVIDKIPKQARDQHIEEAIKRGNMVCNVLVEAVMRGSGFSDFPLTDHSYAGPGKPEHDWRIDIGLDWGLRHAHYIASTGGTVYFNSIFPADLNKEQRDTVVNQTAKFKTTSGIPAEAQEGDIVIFLRSIEPVKDKGVDIIYRSYYHEAIVTKSGNKFVLFAARSTGNPSGNQYGEFTSYDDLSASDQKMLLYILRPNYKPVPQTQNINRFQTKLTIGEPTDAYELEANHVAEIVMNMSDPVEVLSLVEKKRDGVRLKSTGTYTAITDVFEMEIDALRGTGQPLPDSERQFFEPRFGLDFSNVRIHDGTRADEIARKINAQAFTLNNEIVFSQNKYKPNTENGRRLLAHELNYHMLYSKEIL